MEVVRRVLIVCIVTVAYALCPISIAQAHPADGYTPNEPVCGYGTENLGLGPECDINELYFVKPYPDPGTLTTAEKYMLAGLTQDGPARARRPWINELYQAVSAYYARTGAIPDEFSDEVMLELAADPTRVSAESLEVFRSPITGRYPRLKAEQFSPGDIYIRPLTEAEKRHFASLSDNCQRLWYGGLWYDPQRQQDVSVRLIGDVFYMRVYGENEVIHTGLHFVWAPQ